MAYCPTNYNVIMLNGLSRPSNTNIYSINIIYNHLLFKIQAIKNQRNVIKYQHTNILQKKNAFPKNFSWHNCDNKLTDMIHDMYQVM